MTAEDWAPYGVGEPDADGWYPDYRMPPADQRPDAVTTSSHTPQIDGSVSAILTHWRLLLADLAEVFHVDLYDPAVRARPYQGVRTMAYSLLDMPTTRLHRALITRG